MTQALDPKTIAAAFEAELARQSLLDFAERMDPSWERAPHLELIAHALERLERREIRRLAVVLPPRMGKTSLARFFVSWYLGKHPEHEIIVASYSAELAEESSRKVRDTIDNPVYPFPGVKLRDDSRSVARFATEQGGVLVATSIEGSATGRGGSLIVADDLVKGRAEADSPAIRKSTREFYDEVLGTRGNSGVVRLFIGTLWRDDDIMSSVCFEGKGAGKWEKIVLPLYAEESGDPLGRAPGAMLWPARFGPEDFPSVADGEISSRSWSAIYGCRPRAIEGNTFKTIWFSKRYRHAPEIGKSVLAIDCASKLGVQNCTSAFAVIRKSIDYYILAVESDQLEFIELEDRVVQLAKNWHPTTILVEDASAGTQVVQRLKALTSLPIRPVVAKLSKLVRAELVTGLFEAKRVLFPDEPWADDVIDEMTRFPAGKNDRTDAIVHGITYLDKSGGDLYVGSAGNGVTKISGDGSATKREVQEFVQHPDPYVPPSYGGIRGAMRNLW